MDTYQSSSVILRRQRELYSHTTAIFASVKCNAFHRGIVSRKECVYSHLLYHGVPVIFPQCLPLNSDFAATAPPPPGAAPSTCRWLRKAVFVLLLDVFLSFIWHHISPHPCLPQYLLLIQFHMSYTWISYIIAVCFPLNITILEQQVLQEEGQFVLTPDRGPVLGSDPRCWMCSDRLLCRPRQSFFMVCCCLMKGRGGFVCWTGTASKKTREERRTSRAVTGVRTAPWLLGLKRMKGLISFDNTQQWVMTAKPPTPSRASVLFHFSTFFFFFPEAWPYLPCRLCYTLPCLLPLCAPQPAACRLCVPR